MASPPDRHRLSLGAALGGLALVAYLPALAAGFVWDDDTFLTKNLLIRAADGLYRFWCTTQPTDYWPLTSSTLWLEWRWWGLHPAGYHATNLLLHVADTLLLWRVLVKLRVPGALLAAAVFAVHPVNVESVAWIAQRKNVLAMLCALVSIRLFLNSAWATPGAINSESGASESRRLPPAGTFRSLAYVLSLVAFIFALLSKGSVVILPAILLGILAWRRRLTFADGLRVLPFVLVALAGTAVNVWFQAHAAGGAIREVSFLQRLLGAGAVPWFYLYKALVPLNLIFVYPQWRVNPNNFLWWLPLIGTVGLTLVLWRASRRGRVGGAPATINGPRAAWFAWGYFLLCLLPVMGLTDVYFMKYSLVADHYQHLAVIGPIVFLSAIAARPRADAARPGAALGVKVAVVAVLAVLTWRQCRLYRDARTLFADTVRHNPESSMAQLNLGLALYQKEHYTEASDHFTAALRLDPGNAEANNDLGSVLAGQGQTAAAIARDREAVRLRPDYPEAHCNLGQLLAGANRLPEAIVEYEKAIAIRADYADAHNDLGIALARSGRLAEAGREFEAALRLAIAQEDQPASIAGIRRNLERVRSPSR